MIPVPQFTIELERIVGEPPAEMETPVSLSIKVNPDTNETGVAPLKAIATDPVALI